MSMKDMSRRQFRVPFHIAIAGAIISIVAIMSLLTFLIIYYRGEANAKANARLLFTEKSMEVRERLDKRLSALIRLASLGAAVPGLETRPSGFGLDHPSLGFLFSIMNTEPSIYGAYAGWSDGDFLMLINTAGESDILEANQAPVDCRFIVRAISGQGSGRAQRWSYLDASRRLLSQRTEQQPSYDPRSRDWYGIASGDEQAHLGKAYVFNSLKAPGITASHTFSNGVFGVDMTLADINSFLNEASPSKGGGESYFWRIGAASSLPRTGRPRGCLPKFPFSATSAACPWSPRIRLGRTRAARSGYGSGVTGNGAPTRDCRWSSWLPWRSSWTSSTRCGRP